MSDLELREEPQDELEQILSTMAFKCAGGITHSGRKEYTDAKQQILDWHNKKVNEARIDELQKTSNELVRLKVPALDYNSKDNFSDVGRYFSGRIKALKEKGGE